VPTIKLRRCRAGLRWDGLRTEVSGKRTHRIVKGVGHNLPQEAPLAFAEAVLDVDRY
jgi:hypothetical protein